MQLSRDFILEHLQAVLIFFILSFLFAGIAASKGFFRLPKLKEMPHLLLLVVLIMFGLYLSFAIFIAPWLARLTKIESFFQLLSAALTLAAFFSFGLCLKSPLFKKIWKNSETSFLEDFKVSAITLFIGFPIVMAIGQLCDLLLYILFHIETYEQVAVHYLKSTLEHPYQLLAAFATILIGAPIIEELLFRGFLQTYLKQYMKRSSSIVLASLIFALFHLSTSQGIGNISLIIALFTFSCFLGFVYEKQGSLYACIFLHLLFNLTSVLRILITG